MAINTILNANKQVVYLCKKINELEWSEPIKLELSIVPTTSDGDIMVYGADFPEFLKTKCSEFVANKFNAGDRIYYKKDLPETHNSLQNNPEDANYEVIAKPIITLNIGDIRFRYINDR